MDKLQRSYKLTVQDIDYVDHTFYLPYTVEFAVERNNFSMPNTASITLYNLSLDTRNKLRKDMVDVDVKRRVTLTVGYGSNQSVIFDGTLDTCWSARQGVNFLTHLACRDNGFVWTNTTVSVPYHANQLKKELVQTIVKQMTKDGVQIGYIGNVKGTFPRSGIADGYACNVVKELTGDTFFIDNNKIFVLSDEEAMTGAFTEISAETGLINTPIIENTFIVVEMIMEPRAFVGQIVKLNTLTGYNYTDTTYHFDFNNMNGDYKIVGIKHSGVISQTVAGNAVTTLTLGGQYVTTTYTGLGL